MDKNNHIILRQIMEVQSSDPRHGLGFQDRVKEMAYTRLLPKMEVLFDEHADQDHCLRINNLEIDAGLLNAANWEAELEQNVLRELDLSLRQAPRSVAAPSKEDQRTASYEKIQEKAWIAFLYFLEHGTLPWYAAYKSVAELEDKALTWWKNEKANNSISEQLKIFLKENPHALSRLCLQGSERLTKELVEGIKGKWDFSKIKAEIDSIVESSHINIDTARSQELIRIIIWENILSDTLPVMKYEDRRNNFLIKVFQNLDQRQRNELSAQVKGKIIAEKKREEKQEKKKEIKVGNELFYFVENAGLVLLHPFLGELFQRARLLKGEKFKNISLQQRAIMLTHYLTTGEEKLAEFALLLNKLLCGYPLEESLPGKIKIKKQEKAEINSLLQTVINEWMMNDTSVNTSVAGLRASFLQRSGKISRIQNGWLLQVEQQSYDIVMNSLPWGIGVIKLPWMEEILMVEWNG